MSDLIRFTEQTNIDPNSMISISKKVLNGTCHVHWHEFYEIECFLSGKGIYNINGKKYEVKKGSVFFMTPIDFHNISTDGDAILVNMMFSEKWLDKEIIYKMLNAQRNIAVYLNNSELEEFYFLLNKISAECVNGHAMKHEYIKNLLECTIIDILRHVENPDDIQLDHSALSNPIQQSLFYLQNHFREPLTLSDAAAYARLSDNYFSEKFHAFTGVAFKEYLLRLRFEYAEKLLLYSDMPVTDVCYESGFSALSYFIRAFNKRYSCSPNNYRKKNRPVKL